MTPELTALTLVALVQFAQMALFGWFAHAEGRDAYQLTPRDEPRPKTGPLGRVQRSIDNHVENLGAFAIAVLVIAASGQSTGWTALLAWVFLAARALYVPAYLRGWVPWRSAFWMVGFLATLLLLLAALV